MRHALRAPLTPRLLGLLICLLGVASVVTSYAELPLYAHLEGGDTVTGWQWTSETITTMQILGVTPSSIFGISWALLPLVAAVFMGLLGIARFAFAKPFLAPLYLIVWLLGSFVLGVTILFVIYGLRVGALGEAVGYALCFAADRVWRSARRPHAALA